MADKEMFSYWVTQPELLQKSDIEKLQELTAGYPYFQLAHMLLAKAVSIGDPTSLSRHLPEASIYSLNRRALQMLIENEMEWSVALLDRLTRSQSEVLVKEEDKFAKEDNKSKPGVDEKKSAAAGPGDRSVPFDPTILAEFTLAGQLGINPEEESGGTSARTPIQELIEKFIKTEPAIGALPSDIPQAEEVEDLSMRSHIELEDLATESFADILAKQGKKEKAIGIYEKLILKMPEKKDYFAKKIEMLK